ncbi:MAG: VWA domain-containing protein [Gammaproteobacteria bacterium]|nr:VWA domain-containing protein [Gammaproteobacteria bacterium]
MARSRRRPLNVFTLSFLDVMAGGFGAVVMIFLIINHQTEDTIKTSNRDQLAEARRLDYRAKDGSENLAELRKIVGELALRIADTKEKMEIVIEEIKEKEEEVEAIEKVSLDQSDALEKLISEVDSTEEEIELLASRASNQRDVIAIEGEGDRQYLTGLFMGGDNILIAIDNSGSMLDSSIVNILRKRNMSSARQVQSPKWIQAVEIVEWLVANVPLESRLQIASFNDQTRLLIRPDDWHAAADGNPIEAVIAGLRTEPPNNGTNLEALFLMISEMSPLPDNIFLVTDGLPTLENRIVRRTTVTGNQRIRLFNEAVPSLPAGIPVNVILLPLEGDPHAAGWYWRLAHVTSGTFMTPSSDWP